MLVLDPEQKLINFYKSHPQKDVKLLISNSKGLSAARNVGIQAAKGAFLAFIDDDAFAKKDWLENLTANFKDASVLGVGGYIKPVWESGRPFWFPEEVGWVVGCSYAGLVYECKSVRNPIGCNMIFRKSVFEKAGFFDTNIGRYGKHLMGSEEAEFSLRALSSFPNSKIINEPSAVVFHWVPSKRACPSYFFKRSYYEGISKRLMKEMTNNEQQALSTENYYLKYIFKVSLIKYAQKLKINSFFQLIMLSCSTSLVFAGYFSAALSKLFDIGE